MTEEPFRLAADFPAASYDDWRALVEKALKGQSFDRKLVSPTYEGFSLQPLYTRQDRPGEGDPSGLPGVAPFTRGGRAGGNAEGGWDIRQVHTHPDAVAGNAAIRDDLANGVTSLHLRLDRTARVGLDPDADAAADLAGRDGVLLPNLAAFDTLLDGVDLARTPVAIEAGAAFLPAAAMLAALWRRRGVDMAAVRGTFGADPLGTLATDGLLPQGLDGALAEAADLAAWAASRTPGVRALRVDTAAYYSAGANESLDLGYAMATGTAYLRALTAAGLDIDTACRQISFSLPLGTDLFLAIAKLRVARRLWARVCEVSGASEAAGAIRLHAATAERIMARRDPWVNMLRTALGCFAGAVGGADSIAVLPFDAALGLPDGFSRRIARNTQLILMEESSLNRVIDPAGGAWFLEDLSDRLAGTAWSAFQEIERAGGIAEALKSGAVAARIEAGNRERDRNLARRRDALTGVSEFPNLLEQPIEREPPDYPALRAAAVATLGADRQPVVLPSASDGARMAAAVDAAAAGASIGMLATAGPALRIEPLRPHRLGEAYEALRDAADAFRRETGAWPRVFLANLGPIAKFNARATFAKNFFEAGGIEAIGNDGFSDPSAAAEAFRQSGARIACLCSSDDLYPEFVPAAAAALKAAGAELLFLAGAPRDNRDAWTTAGVDEFVYIGADVLATLRDTLTKLAVTRS